jgi:hypothetical protein
VQARCERFGGLTVVPVRHDPTDELPLAVGLVETTSNEEIIRIIHRDNWGSRMASHSRCNTLHCMSERKISVISCRNYLLLH